MQPRPKFEKSQRSFCLTPTGIDETSEWLVDKLEQAGVDKRDRTRARLLLEKALINMANHYGEGQEVTANLDKRWGGYRLRLATKGEQFNPLKPDDESDQDELSTSLFSVIDMHLQYTYSMGANVLRMSMPRPSWNPVLKIIIAIVTGTVIGALDFSTIDDLASSSKRLLGIDSEFARAIYPQGLFLYMPTSGIGICVFILYAAQMLQMNVDQAWLIAVIVLSVVLAVATPPLTGANLLSFVVAFTYLGISSDAFLAVMVFDIVFGVLCIAFDQAMLQVETINQAERMGFLKEEVLRAPLPGDRRA